MRKLKYKTVRTLSDYPNLISYFLVSMLSVFVYFLTLAQTSQWKCRHNHVLSPEKIEILRFYTETKLNSTTVIQTSRQLGRGFKHYQYQ